MTEIKRKRKSRKVQIATKTRVCTNYESVYSNTPTREIRKWFESRRITPLP